MEPMRLFIAILLEENILEELTDFQENLRARGVSGNYTSRENLHITLAFIGDYGDPDAVLDAINSVDFEPFEVKLKGVGSFGDLFWVGLEDNPELDGYVKRLRRELADHGIPFDKKRFSPHITLVRKASFKDGKAIPFDKTPSGSMTATCVSLMKSERGKHGMIYTEIGEV